MFKDLREVTKKDGKIFIDRHPKYFETLVNYLKDDRKEYPTFEDDIEEDGFATERKYWGIFTPINEINYIESHFAPDIVQILKNEPGTE